MGVPKFPKLGLPWLCLQTSDWDEVWSKVPNGSPEIPKVGIPATLGPITLSADLQLRWGLKQSCSPCRELSNDMWHATCTQGNRGDSWLLVVGSQINNLTHGPSFGHNLCFRCPNGSCEPISDIYVLKAFQWYNKCFDPMSFDPCNCPLKIWESIWYSNSQNGSSLGSVRVHSSHSFALLGA
jgi:hypothetical protein